MKKALYVFCFLLLVFSIAGCAAFRDTPEKTAPELVAEGRRYFEKENYTKAAETYKRLKDWYPYSQYAKEAELRIADSNFHLEKYEEALFAYEQYEELHPNDSMIPYVIFQIGRSHYDRMKGIDRTQVPAQKALEAFERLRSRFPRSEYSERAEPLIEDVKRNLAGHEFYVGRFYFKSGYYKAAIERLEKMIAQYPGVDDYKEDAQEYIEEAREYLQSGDTGEREFPEPPGETGTPIGRDGADPVL